MAGGAEDPGGFADPLRGPASSRRYWTTVNAAEALPGVPTPLNWSWYDEGTERAQARCLAELGVVPAGGAGPSPDRDERHLGMFFGHAALNVDVWRRMADAIPGASGTALERDLLGAVRPGRPTRPQPGRYPFVAVKLPRAMARARRAIEHDAGAHRDWWRGAVAGVQGASEGRARAAFAQAFHSYENVAVPHLVATMGAQALYDALRRLGERVGEPGLEARLTTGLGTLEEGAMLRRLWALAHDGGELDDFLHDYGYQGPAAGELANRSWRVEPALLEPVLRTYRNLPEHDGPAAAELRQRREREQAEAVLLGALPRVARAPARALMQLAGAYLPLRESGRAGVLRAVDAARAAARVLGELAAADGRMHRPEDVFMLTVAELTGAAPAPGSDELAFRRERWVAYRALDVPAVWQGVPVTTAIAQAPEENAVELDGVGAAAGEAEGRVRVVTDPADQPFEPGEILVCHTTDPSWASLFLLATAVVIDIGGALSHGAIVARELGIPCVINTKDGSRRLRTGDLVSVDGRRGTVRRLARADESVAG